MKEIDLAYRMLFAELAQRSLDAAFITDFSVEGRFVTVPVKGRKYWYFDPPAHSDAKRIYVGPHTDAEITRRVETFNEIKSDLRARRKLVSTLTRDAGLPAPERFTGDIVLALAEAGLFRMRGVLVGAVAFQCYPGLLGIRFPNTSLHTGDADFAQFHSISAAVEDSLPPILDVLKTIDGSFREIPHQTDSRFSTKFVNANRFAVEFLTPNRGSSAYDDKPAPMPALGGASAQPLRFLDFLIHEPVRSVLLHKSGVNVVVPAPERYAIHKLIVADRRREDSLGRLKSDKDVLQAALLTEALVETRRGADLAEVFVEAWDRGRGWQESLRKGLLMAPRTRRFHLDENLSESLREIGKEPKDYGIAT